MATGLLLLGRGAAALTTIGSLPKRLLDMRRAIAAIEWPDLFWSSGVALAALLLGRIVAALLGRAFERWVRHTQTQLDDAVLRHLRRPVNWLLPLVALNLVLPATALPERLLGVLEHVLLIAGIVGVGWLLLAVVRVLEEVVQRRYDPSAGDSLRARDVQTQFRGFRNIVSFLIVLVTIAFVLLTFERVRQVGAGMLASAGLAGIVIGFAAQRTLGTLLAGIQLALSQSILVGDALVLENEFGTVEEITLTYVVVRLWDQRRLIVPVSYFMEKPFQNWTRVSPEVLGVVTLRVDYTIPVQPVREELKRVLDASAHWDKRAWALQVTDADASAVTLRALMSAKDASTLFTLRCEVRERLIAFVQERFPDSLPRLRGLSSA